MLSLLTGEETNITTNGYAKTAEAQCLLPIAWVAMAHVVSAAWSSHKSTRVILVRQSSLNVFQTGVPFQPSTVDESSQWWFPWQYSHSPIFLHPMTCRALSASSSILKPAVKHWLRLLSLPKTHSYGWIIFPSVKWGYYYLWMKTILMPVSFLLVNYLMIIKCKAPEELFLLSHLCQFPSSWGSIWYIKQVNTKVHLSLSGVAYVNILTPS